MRFSAFPKTIFCLALLLCWGNCAPPVTAQVQVGGVFVACGDVNGALQTVEVRYADGSTSSAEFLSEIILLPDGRANGGLGLLERGTPDVLTLYRVVEGRVSSDVRGPFFEFKAERLSPLLPGDEITVILRPAPPPTGTVTFFIDGVDRGPLSFVAKGRVLQLPPGVSANFNLAYIEAPPQTVVVQTTRGNYTAYFTNVGLVFPSVGAIGTLELTAPGGELLRYDAFYGTGVYKSTDSGKTWSLIMQQARLANAKPTPGDEITIILRPGADSSQPGLSYDILSRQGQAHFVATGGVRVGSIDR